MKMLGLGFVLCVILMLGQSASAQVTRLSGGGYNNGVVPNTITNDLSIDFRGKYTGSQLLIELTAGSIYQNFNGGDTAPEALLFTIDPLVEFDSFVTNDSEVAGGLWGGFALGGGAANFSGSRHKQFDTSGVDVSWFPAAGSLIFDQSDFLTARITLSDDAEGTWSYMASANGTFGVVDSMPISNGSMKVDPIGDYNGNGTVGGAELDIVLLNWGTDDFETIAGGFPIDPASIPGGSFDGTVSQNELSAVLLNWGNSANSWRVVPEQVDPADTGGNITGIEADYNGSFLVEQADLDMVLLNWGTGVFPGDQDNIPGGGPYDGLTSGNELDGVLLNWGNTTLVASSQAVPEPTGLVLFLLACATFAPKRVR